MEKSYNNTKYNYTPKPKLPLIKESTTYKLTVTANLEKKIRHLCEVFPRNEYSGTLFYAVEGSFEENNLHIIAKDFFLQDIGVSAYTEFNDDVELAHYIVTHDLLDCYTGLMHSHNTMSAFFSSTDTSTLLSEGTDANHFVSLIVNNDGEYTAAVTRHLNTVYNVEINGTKNSAYNSWNNEAKENTEPYFEKTDITKEKIEYYYLDITIEDSEEFEDNYEEIEELNDRIQFLKDSDLSYVNSYRRKTSTLTLPFEESSYVEANYKFNSTKEVSKLDALVQKHVIQLVTCNIFGHLNPKIDLHQWAYNLEKLVPRRFASGNGILNYHYYIDVMLDILIEDLPGDTMADRDTETWATKMITVLSNLPQNTYIEYIIYSLQQWQ